MIWKCLSAVLILIAFAQKSFLPSCITIVNLKFSYRKVKHKTYNWIKVTFDIHVNAYQLVNWCWCVYICMCIHNTLVILSLRLLLHITYVIKLWKNNLQKMVPRRMINGCINVKYLCHHFLAAKPSFLYSDLLMQVPHLAL